MRRLRAASEAGAAATRRARGPAAARRGGRHPAAGTPAAPRASLLDPIAPHSCRDARVLRASPRATRRAVARVFAMVHVHVTVRSPSGTEHTSTMDLPVRAVPLRAAVARARAREVATAEASDQEPGGHGGGASPAAGAGPDGLATSGAGGEHGRGDRGGGGGAGGSGGGVGGGAGGRGGARDAPPGRIHPVRGYSPFDPEDCIDDGERDRRPSGWQEIAQAESDDDEYVEGLVLPEELRRRGATTRPSAQVLGRRDDMHFDRYCPPSPDEFSVDHVWRVMCGCCGWRLTERGMAVELVAHEERADPLSTIPSYFSTDDMLACVVEVGDVSVDEKAEHCDCTIRPILCEACRWKVGYRVMRACKACSGSSTNGHRLIFDPDEVALCVARETSPPRPPAPQWCPPRAQVDWHAPPVLTALLHHLPTAHT